MFTRQRLFLPQLTGEWGTDGPRVLKAFNEFLLALEGPGGLAITETEVTTPTPAATSGTITTASSSVKCTRINGDAVIFDARITITTNGTGAGAISVAMPFTSSRDTGGGGIVEVASTGLAWFIDGGTLYVVNAGGTYPGSDGAVLSVSGVFHTQ